MLVGELLLVADEGVVLGEEEHTVALLPLPHRHTGAVPVGQAHFRRLVLVVPARAQGRPQLLFVLGQPWEGKSIVKTGQQKCTRGALGGIEAP